MHNAETLYPPQKEWLKTPCKKKNHNPCRSQELDFKK